MIKTMNYIFTLLTLVIFMSCGTKKNQTTSIITNNIINTQLKITVHVPYCGGARPTDDMLNIHKPVSATFILRGDNGYEKKVTSNELGLVSLALPIGTYHLKELSKDVPFETFLATEKVGKGNFIQIGNSDCYKEWWQKNVINFEITDTTTLLKADGRLYSNCYTKNPCDRYTGPYAP